MQINLPGGLEIEDAKFMRRPPAQDEETRVRAGRGRSPCNGRANWFRLPAPGSSFQSRFEFNCKYVFILLVLTDAFSRLFQARVLRKPLQR